jgi:hypothetical protein
MGDVLTYHGRLEISFCWIQFSLDLLHNVEVSYIYCRISSESQYKAVFFQWHILIKYIYLFHYKKQIWSGVWGILISLTYSINSIIYICHCYTCTNVVASREYPMHFSSWHLSSIYRYTTHTQSIVVKSKKIISHQDNFLGRGFFWHMLV